MHVAWNHGKALLRSFMRAVLRRAKDLGSRRLAVAAVSVAFACLSTSPNYGATSSANLTAQLSVAPSCTILAGGSVINFGTRSFISTNLNASTAIAVQCTNTTPWSVGLDNGQNSNGAQRRMASGSYYLNYSLFTDNARTLPFLTSSSAVSCTGGAGTCILGTGTGAYQFITIYGQTPPQTAAPGFYSDTITATVTY